MRIKVLASGSKGNSTYIECGSTKILIDAGISFLQIKNSLSSINVDVNDIDIILITHSHADHIKGLATLLRRTNITLYTTEEVFNDITKTIDVPRGHIIDEYFMFRDVLIDVYCHFLMMLVVIAILLNIMNMNLYILPIQGI